MSAEPSLLQSIGNSIVDTKDELLGRAPLNRNAPAPPQNPPVETIEPTHAPQLSQLEEAHEKLQQRPTFIPPAKPEQQLMMDTLQSMGVRDLGRDFFFFRQFYTEKEISVYWKEFSEAKNKADGQVTVGNLNRIGGRRPEFEHVARALSGQSQEQTLNFSQFLGLLKKQKSLDTNQAPTNPSELFRPEVFLNESDHGGIHSSSDEERFLLLHFVNLMLEKDETVQGILPIDYQSSKFGMEFADGGLFCKLINRIRPDTINEDVFHFGEGLHFLQIMDNHVTNLKAARLIGLDVADVDPRGLIEGENRQVLAFLEQLFRMVFGTGSHTYNKNEVERLSQPELYRNMMNQSEGLLGKPMAPGYFLPNTASPSQIPLNTIPSESKLIELERGTVPVQSQAAFVQKPQELERIRSLEAELERYRTNENNRQAQLESLSHSYNNLLNELNLAKAKQNLDMAENSQRMERMRLDDQERARMESQRMDRMRQDEVERLRMDGERAERERMERERATPATSVPSSSYTSAPSSYTPAPASYTSVASSYTPVASSYTSVPSTHTSTPSSYVVASSEPVPSSTERSLPHSGPQMVPLSTPLAAPQTVSLAGNAGPVPQVIQRAGDALVKGILRWKRRYIALDGNMLYIYKNSGVGSARHSINMYGAVINRDTDASKEFAVYVHNDAQKQKAHIAFSSAALMNEWMNDFTLAQRQAQPSDSRRQAGVFVPPVSTLPRQIVASPASARRAALQSQAAPVGSSYQNANYGSNFQPVFSVSATPKTASTSTEPRTAPNPTFIK